MIEDFRTGADVIVLSGRGLTFRTLETRAVLLQLGDAVPADVERFDRVNELVAPDPADRAQARLRWRHYAAHGHSPRRHDVAQPAEHHDPR